MYSFKILNRVNQQNVWKCVKSVTKRTFQDYQRSDSEKAAATDKKDKKSKRFYDFGSDNKDKKPKSFYDFGSESEDESEVAELVNAKADAEKYFKDK